MVDSTATVIGAMTAAPLATPILAVDLAIPWSGDHDRSSPPGGSAAILAMSVVIIGFVLALILPIAVTTARSA